MKASCGRLARLGMRLLVKARGWACAVSVAPWTRLGTKLTGQFFIRMRFCYRCNGFGWVDCGCERSSECDRCHGSREISCPICTDRQDDAYVVLLGIVMAIGVVIYFW